MGLPFVTSSGNVFGIEQLPVVVRADAKAGKRAAAGEFRRHAREDANQNAIRQARDCRPCRRLIGKAITKPGNKVLAMISELG